MYTMMLRPYLSLLILVGLTLCGGNAYAQSYITLSVKGRVQLEVPGAWTVSDAEHRKRVTELSEKLSGMRDTHVAALSVQSFPTPSKMFVRVSFIKMDPPLTQLELQRQFNANPAMTLREIADGWNSEAPGMWAALSKAGVREVGKPSFSVEQLGGQAAIVIRYARTSVNNPKETMKVAQYHVLLGPEKALITLSSVENDAEIKTTYDRIKNSITIR
jgi:hypothetical protein